MIESFRDWSQDRWLAELEKRHPTEIEMGLDRISLVAESLGCLDFSCPIVSVAGTNGKGSCVEALKCLAKATGLNVATYTSPHFLVFNERISVNGENISQKDLVAAFVKVESALNSLNEQRAQNKRSGSEPDISLTYFEFTTLAALVYFAAQKLDLMVLEVGLGGRLDAVNIVDSDISVITSVGLDHQDFLGDTLEIIGLEKAGIARSKKPCVLGINLPDSVYAYLEDIGSVVYQLGEDFWAAYDVKELTGENKTKNRFWEYKDNEIFLKGLPLGSLAISNISLAIKVLRLLGFGLLKENTVNGISEMSLLGRCQIEKLAGDENFLVLDVAHNPAASLFFRQELSRHFDLSTFNIAIIFGSMVDKDMEGVLDPFLDLANRWLIAGLDSPRAMDPEEIAKFLEQKSIKNVSCFDSPQKAFSTIKKDNVKKSMVIVMGSFYAVAPVLDSL